MIQTLNSPFLKNKKEGRLTLDGHMVRYRYKVSGMVGNIITRLEFIVLFTATMCFNIVCQYRMYQYSVVNKC